MIKHLHLIPDVSAVSGLALAALALLAPLSGGARAQTPVRSASIRVDLNAEKAPVSPTLYGLFMEEISHGFDGGIYAELIQNRSFEEGVLPPGMKLVKNADGSQRMELQSLPAGVPPERWDIPWPWNGNAGWDPNRALIGWSLQNEGGAGGTMELTEANPMNAASSRSLAMTVSPPTDPNGRTALVNSGYWGMDVRTGTPYALTFYLRPTGYTGRLTATLESEGGQVLAKHDFGMVKPSAAWRKYKATLKATGSDPKAHFVLAFRGQGALQVDWVSLFPPTWRNRPNGLRADLAQKLADYKPSFVRYPGGCYVEGFSWANAPDWRRTVAPPEDRPGMWGYWTYRSTDGFGYHEYLQFCEDIGADALYVAFAGMTVHPDDNVPMDQLGPVIQQALDSIEYAIGPTTSKWGAVRAKMGHPKPFPLKYVEIGNEHPPAEYGDYYKAFRDAIKAKYPQITVVMSMYWAGLNQGAIRRAGDENIDIVDEHSYKGSGWIRTNFDYFDRYPRKPWSVYVGEYAHHHNSGDWSAAMDDSVYMMMMERNGDLVKMASYAPLFANLNDRDWGVNLIEYDSSRSFAHASYYVQKLYNQTRPDVNLATTVDTLPKRDPAAPLMAGKFGLGAWDTQTEFKELRVYDEDGRLVYSDDFKDLSAWDTPGTGQWSAENGVLRQTGSDSPARLFLKTPEFRTGKITVKARRVGGREGFLLLFGSDGKDRFLFGNFGAAGNAFTAIQEHGVPDGLAFRGGRSTEGAMEQDRWYDLTLVVTRDRAEMSLDGKKISDAGMEAMPSFFATGGYSRKAKAVVLRATNYGDQPVTAEVDLDGAANVGATGTHTVIRADRLDDENSLDAPERITPREQPLTIAGPRFSVTLPPRSVNVLRIPATPMKPATPATPGA